MMSRSLKKILTLMFYELGNQTFSLNNFKKGKKSTSNFWKPLLGTASVEPLLGNRSWETAFGKPLLGNRFWKTAFGEPLLGNRFWETAFGKPLLGNHFWGTALGQPLLGNRF